MRVNRRVRLGILGALAAVVVAGVGVGLQQASAATVNTGAWYVFVNRHSGKAMDVFEWSTADGARIAQWARLDGVNQQWQFVDAGNGYYKVRSRHSGKLLELPNATDGTDLVQTTDRGDNRQQFRLVDSDSGYVRFVNRHSNKALDVWAWSTADGGRIVGYSDLNGFNQQWQMVQVGTGAPSPTSPPPPTSGCGSGTGEGEVTLSGSTRFGHRERGVPAVVVVLHDPRGLRHHQRHRLRLG